MPFNRSLKDLSDQKDTLHLFQAWSEVWEDSNYHAICRAPKGTWRIPLKTQIVVIDSSTAAFHFYWEYQELLKVHSAEISWKLTETVNKPFNYWPFPSLVYFALGQTMYKNAVTRKRQQKYTLRLTPQGSWIFLKGTTKHESGNTLLHGSEISIIIFCQHMTNPHCKSDAYAKKFLGNYSDYFRFGNKRC